MDTATTPDPEHSHEPISTEALPGWALEPFRVFDRRLENESKYLHLALRGMSMVRHRSRILKVLGESEKQELEAADRDAEWIAREAKDGFRLLHAHAAVAVWGALEVLAEDFAVAWLANRDDAWSKSEVEKLKISLSQYHSLGVNERPQFVVRELQRALRADVRKGVGKLKAVLSVFDLAPPVGDNAKQALHELCQVRNAIVHCGGLADKKLVEECPWFEAEPDARIEISHDLYAWYFMAARRFSERVLNQGSHRARLPRL